MNASLSMDEVFIKKLRDIVVNNLADENFSVEELAKEAGVSRFSLYRRLRSAKQKDATLFIREIRLQKAMEMLKLKEGTVAEIAFRVGFGSPTYFNKCFHEYYGYPPGEIRKGISETSEVSRKVVEPVSSHKKRNKAAIFAGLIILFALITTGLFIIPKLFTPDERSIAVLPFKLLSNEPDKQYLADGVMEYITLQLSKIKDLRVLGRTSTEQYRNTTTTTATIGKELNVKYLLEGSFQKSGDSVRLIVQLIKTSKEGHVWANNYDRLWKNIFSVQSEVAQSIAKELKATITPDEKQLIEKVPTTNLTAYDFYQRGSDELARYLINNNNMEALEKASNFYHKAVKYDSTFAQAYTGLGHVYMFKKVLTFNEYFTKNVLDSIMIFADIALSFNDQCSEAYNLKGFYYSEMGKSEQAIEEYDKAIKLNPNNWMAYWGKGNLYYAYDLVNHINCLQKASSLYRGQGLPKLLSDIGWAYTCAGFSEKAKYYYQERLRLDDDSSTYYYHLGLNEWCFLNFNKCIEFEERAYAMDSTNIFLVQNLAQQYSFSGRYKESLKYFKKDLDKVKNQGSPSYSIMGRIGYAFWQNGQKDSAEYYFSEHIKYCKRMIELKRSWGEKFYTYYDLAGVYAFKGEKAKAYENLRIFNQIQRVPSWMPSIIKNDPLFGSIRNEPEFQQIVRDMEAKYQAEHERVRKWLEEQEKL